MMDHQEQQTPFKVRISQDSGSALVSFSGELDIFTAPNMRQAFLDPEVSKASQVQVNLTKATFFDSSAMGVVVAACKRARTDGREFGVICPQGAVVWQVLKMSGLTEYLQVGPAA